MKYMAVNWSCYEQIMIVPGIERMKLPKKYKRARFEMLPLMDIVFLLLVFLIYAMLSMAVQRGMPVSLPVSTNAPKQETSTLSLTIQQDGSLWLDKTPVQLEQLAAEINRSFHGEEEKKEPVLQIFADADLPYQKLFNVLDVLKQADLKKVSLQARERVKQ